MDIIGIFGGRFDPIHRGHLMMAQKAREALGLSELRLLPCGDPPHRDPPVASAVQRRTMLELALQDQTGLVIDDRELLRAGPSYMVDTLTDLRDENPDVSLVLILGADAFCGLSSWHKWQQLFHYAHLLVLARPNYSEPDDKLMMDFLSDRWSRDAEDLAQSPAGRVMRLDLGLIDISATQIRQGLQRGNDLDSLLPLAVAAFIRTHNLYI